MMEDKCGWCGRDEEECENNPDACEGLLAERVHAMALDFEGRWEAIKAACAPVPYYTAVKTNDELAAMVKAANDLEDEMSELVDDREYVFAYKDDKVLLVGNGEDGLYCVERPLLKKAVPGKGTATDRVLEEVKKEREKQDKKWGGPEHDDKHTLDDWASFIYKRLDLIDFSVDARQRLLEIAALAAAAIESLDRKNGV